MVSRFKILIAACYSKSEHYYNEVVLCLYSV
jgi:hypothetical protein